MTTKHRIISGFIIMIALLAGMAYIGHSALGTASNYFMTYDRMARLNVLMSDTGTAMSNTENAIERFFATYDTAHIAAANKSLDIAVGFLNTSRTLARAEKEIKDIKHAVSQLAQYKTLVKGVEDEVVKSRKDYHTTFQSAVDKFVVEINNVSDGARSTGSTEVQATLNRIWEAFSLSRRDVASYMETLEGFKAEAATQSLKRVAVVLDEMDSIMKSDSARKDYVRITAAYKQLADAFTQLAKDGRVAWGLLEKTHTIETEVAQLIVETNALVDKQMLDYSRDTLQNNTDAQTSMVVVSFVGLLLGLGIASLIIYMLVRVLRGMADYANAVAMGDFEKDPNIKEKGEIGSMLEALHGIPDILNDVVSSCDAVSVEIGGGQFRTRLDVGSLKGRFHDLIDAVNHVADAYTEVIDSLPVGIMTASKDKKIRFLNKNLQSVFHGEHKGEFCGDCFKTAACPSDSTCLGVCTMKANQLVSGEVQIHPGGKRMDLSVSASPLRDRNGVILGYMEVLSDITVIRTAQETMSGVAHEAAEISSRVAAASEELAAQVEQVARGAEMQRQRVESTASAMTEMNATVIEVARNASQASEQSDGTRQNAESGAKLVSRVVSAINNVNTVAGRLQINMNDLGKQAESIGEVLNVISDIADQTNLLALNAAIEAARAGEAGRGFAVVADEVRKLAEKTMEATQEVGQRIASMQNATTTNITEVESAVKSVTEATGIANSSGEALSEIVHRASETSQFVASIATAAEEQSATSEEISNAITDINQIVSETTDGMVQSSHAVRDLSRMAQELRSVMQRLQ